MSMEFWQGIALVFMVLAFWMSGAEVWQVWMQRKVVTAIYVKLENFDETVSDYSNKAAITQKAVLEAFADTLRAEVAPIVCKLNSLNLDGIAAQLAAAVEDAIKNYGASIDLQPVIDAFADTLLEKAQAAIPVLIEDASNQAKAQVPGMMGLDPKLMAEIEKHPLAALLSMAMTAQQSRAAAPQQQIQAQPGTVKW